MCVCVCVCVCVCGYVWICVVYVDMCVVYGYVLHVNICACGVGNKERKPQLSHPTLQYHMQGFAYI